VNHVSGDWYGQKTESFYTYDKNGNMATTKELTEDNPEWNWEYTYDSLGRLIKEYWWEKTGKDTAMVALSHWTWNIDGTILKEDGKGRGWKDIYYERKGDTLKIDFSRGAEFGPSYKYKMHLTSDKKLVDYMLQTSPKGWKEEELWYEYIFY
jgi:YD repeat-containing protein